MVISRSRVLTNSGYGRAGHITSRYGTVFRSVLASVSTANTRRTRRLGWPESVWAVKMSAIVTSDVMARARQSGSRVSHSTKAFASIPAARSRVRARRRIWGEDDAMAVNVSD